MTSPRWVNAMSMASAEANEIMRQERETIERLKAQIGLLLEGQTRYVTQVVLQYHLRRVDMIGVHTADLQDRLRRVDMIGREEFKHNE